MFRKQVLVVASGLTLLGSLSLVAREPLMLALGDSLVIQDELQPADVIHVISGPDDRTDYGIQLYKQGYGSRMFFTGGWCAEIDGVHAVRGREQAVAQGVPPEAVAIDSFQVTSTYSEAVRLKDFVAQSALPVHSVILVSDPYHMRRARWTYRLVLGPGIKVQTAPIPFSRSIYQRQWWTDARSEKYVRDEYLKLGYYFLRYRVGWTPLQGWLASLDKD